MTIIRPPTLSPEEMEKLLAQLADRGARITMTDPRVSATTNWLLGTIGAVCIVVGGWLIQSVNRLSETMAVVIQQNSNSQRINDAQDTRLSGYDDRLRQVERQLK